MKYSSTVVFFDTIHAVLKADEYAEIVTNIFPFLNKTNLEKAKNFHE